MIDIKRGETYMRRLMFTLYCMGVVDREFKDMFHAKCYAAVIRYYAVTRGTK